MRKQNCFSYERDGRFSEHTNSRQSDFNNFGRDAACYTDQEYRDYRRQVRYDRQLDANFHDQGSDPEY